MNVFQPVVPGAGQVVVDPRGEGVPRGGRRYVDVPHGRNCYEEHERLLSIIQFITFN